MAHRAHNRDWEKLPGIVYGLLADGQGCPIAVDVYPGNTGDPSTDPDQVEKLRAWPIRHRNEAHVRAHIFLCMLAYYVEWHMRKALCPVLFRDEEIEEARWTRDPVAKAGPSRSAREKKRAGKTGDGWPVHSLRKLLTDLATCCKNTCRAGEGKTLPPFEQVTEPTPFQEHVFTLLGL